MLAMPPAAHQRRFDYRPAGLAALASEGASLAGDALWCTLNNA
jgi:hypothetical protein